MNPLVELIEPKIRKILQVLLKNRGKLYHLHQISTESKVSPATTFRLVKKLVALGFIDVTPVGKLKIYHIADNKKTKNLDLGRADT